MSAFTLKLLALVTMIIDHVGAIFFPQFIWLRYIGRLSMPIYAFLLVQGYMHTRNFNRYALRMGIFALLSEVPYDLLFQGTWLEFQRQNILFTFLTALFVMKLLDASAKSRNIFMFIGAVILTILPYFLHFSYGVYGVLTVLCFYLFQKYRGIDAVAFAALAFEFQLHRFADLGVCGFNKTDRVQKITVHTSSFPSKNNMLCDLCAAVLH